MNDFDNWYERVRPELHHQGLWLRGGEPNTLPRSQAEARPLHALFARLSTYQDTGYSFTHQILYQIACGVDGVFADLAYLPPRGDLAIFERDRIPWLLGTQTHRPAAAFDLLGFSLSIVQEMLNLPACLAKSGIPRLKSERMERADLPLILLGGASALYTTALWNADPLVDAIFVGEDDGTIRRIMEICRDAKASGLHKRRTLELLEAVPGLMQPDRPRATHKAFIMDLNQSEALRAAPVYHLDDMLGSSHLQISEGCPAFCSFCAESWDRKPYRERRAPVLAAAALAAKAAMGLEEIDIYSFNFNMHSDFYRIIWDLVPLFRRIGLKSQRFDLLAHDPEMIEFQHAIEKASITCGLEGISPRLRRYLHKNTPDDDLHRSLDAIFRSRARALKIFLIATGLEEEEDFQALEDLLEHVRHVRQLHGDPTRVIFSVTPLVRFPWTPLEYEDSHPRGRYERIVGEIAGRIRKVGFEFRESAELSENWVSQVLVRAADPGIGAAMIAAVDAENFVYYREISDSFRDAFERELVARGLDPDALICGHDFASGEAKPWTMVATGVHRKFLYAEVERAREYKEIDYCLGRAWQKAKCFHCGGCPTKDHVRDIVLARQERHYSLEELRARIADARAGETTVWIEMEVGERGRGTLRKTVGVALASALMQSDPVLARAYRGYAGSAIQGDSNMPVWVSGADAIGLMFQPDGARALESLLADPARRAQAQSLLEDWGEIIGLAQAGWRPEFYEIESPFPFAPAAALARLHVGASQVRLPDGGIAFDFTKAALKKKLLRRLEARPGAEPSASSIRIQALSKFDIHAFIRDAFSLPRREDWIRIQVRSMGAASGAELALQSR